MSVLRHPMALTIFLTSLVAAPAFAQSPSAPASKPAEAPSSGLTVYPECKTMPTEAESEAAHGAYLAGKGSFDEADYTTAITYFKDAYRRDCTKYELLNALARAFEAKGEPPEAIHALETYLRRAPATNPGNADVQRRIAALKAQMAPPPAGGSGSAPSQVTPSTTSSTTTTTAPAPHEGDRPAPVHTIYPWIVAGGGAVVAIVGVSLWAIGNGQVSQSKDDASAAGCSGTSCPDGVNVKPFQDKNDSGTTKKTLGVVLVGVGAAAIAGGLVWHFVEPSLARSRKVHARPDVGPGYAGLSLGGAF
ncbi:tetratricopeptide repeat protein [Pendulispora rubella]|uniref:Tetratricopeptide repeat protein n=1 Tax=Pendulispora rubella TaxID=2741070 RepID=A0ABZ2L3F3_9BACT